MVHIPRRPEICQRATLDPKPPPPATESPRRFHKRMSPQTAEAATRQPHTIRLDVHPYWHGPGPGEQMPVSEKRTCAEFAQPPGADNVVPLRPKRTA